MGSLTVKKYAMCLFPLFKVCVQGCTCDMGSLTAKVPPVMGDDGRNRFE